MVFGLNGLDAIRNKASALPMPSSNGTPNNTTDNPAVNIASENASVKIFLPVSIFDDTAFESSTVIKGSGSIKSEMNGEEYKLEVNGKDGETLTVDASYGEKGESPDAGSPSPPADEPSSPTDI